MTVLLLFSSPQTLSDSIGFGSEDWNGHSRSLVLCSVTHLCVVFKVCFWNIVRLEDPNMAHNKISNRVSHLLFFFCWYLIESHNIKNTAVYFIVHMGYFFYPCVHQTNLECFLLKSYFFWFHLTIEASPI